MHISNGLTPQFSKLHLSLWGKAPGVLGITSWDPWSPQACLCLPSCLHPSMMCASEER